MRIKDVEALVGITKKNIRFYEDAGLLSPGRNSENSYREYSMADVDRLRKIKYLRRLDMPVSEIRELLSGTISLQVAAKRHELVLDERMKSIELAKTVCNELTEGSDLETLDAEAALIRMDELEKGGLHFVNVEKHDVRKKYTGAVAACFGVIVFMGIMAGLLLWALRETDASTILRALIIAVPSIVAIGVVAALITRIREIRGGEENDLSNY